MSARPRPRVVNETLAWHELVGFDGQEDVRERSCFITRESLENADLRFRERRLRRTRQRGRRCSDEVSFAERASGRPLEIEAWMSVGIARYTGWSAVSVIAPTKRTSMRCVVSGCQCDITSRTRCGLPSCVPEYEITDDHVADRLLRAVAKEDQRVRRQTPRTPVVVRIALEILDRERLRGRVNGHASPPVQPWRRRRPSRARSPSRPR